MPCPIHRFLPGIHRFTDQKSSEKSIRAQRDDVSLSHQSLIIETMEQESKSSSPTGFSGKLLVASLFILSGILLFARNMGRITAELSSIVASWYSLFIIMGIYSTMYRHFVGGTIPVLIDVYFLLGGLS